MGRDMVWFWKMPARFIQRRYWVADDTSEGSRLNLAAKGGASAESSSLIHEMLKAVTERRANFGCYGLMSGQWFTDNRRRVCVMRFSTGVKRIRDRRSCQVGDMLQPL